MNARDYERLASDCNQSMQDSYSDMEFALNDWMYLDGENKGYVDDLILTYLTDIAMLAQDFRLPFGLYLHWVGMAIRLREC